MTGQMLAQVLAQNADPGFEISLFWALPSLIIGGGVGALIGSSKNRLVLGLVLGLFLGCIGWIIMAIIPRKD